MSSDLHCPTGGGAVVHKMEFGLYVVVMEIIISFENDDCLAIGIGNGLSLTSKDQEDLLSNIFKSCERKTGKCQPISSVFVVTCLCFSSSTLEKQLA